MIKRLRSRFIRIATLSVAAVMLLLTVILNVVNYVSTDSDLRSTLTLIYENQGTIPVSNQGGGLPDTGDVPPPEPPQGGPNERDGHFTPETPFSTRYFVLRYEDDGTLVLADLTKIASVTDADTAEYLTAALKNGEGYGRCGSYRFFVAHTGDDQNMAIFLDSYQQFRAIRLLLLWSLLADVGCTLLVLLLVVLLSRRAIDPVVRSAQQQKQFITDASHELKTPMTTIAGYTDGILDGTIPPERERHYLQIISDESRRLSRLVRRMLDISQIQSKEMKKEDFDICEVMRIALLSMEQKINDRGLDVETNIPDDPTMVQGDRDLITQVIYNLLENAAKFATPHTALYLGLATNDEKAIISVRNHGATIAPEEIPLLFERFHKSDKSRSEDKDGYGLGLYVVKTILAQHKEHISVTSENGLTSFDFTLQLTSPHNT